MKWKKILVLSKRNSVNFFFWSAIYVSGQNVTSVPEAFHARFPLSVVLKSEWLRRSCLRPLADETKLPVAREKKPLVPRVVKWRANRNFARTNSNLDRTLSVDRLLFWALKPRLRLVYLSPFTETDPHVSNTVDTTAGITDVFHATKKCT